MLVRPRDFCMFETSFLCSLLSLDGRTNICSDSRVEAEEKLFSEGRSSAAVLLGV